MTLMPVKAQAWREWNGELIERMADDSRHLLADIQDVMQAGANLLPNGAPWRPVGPTS